MAKTESIENGIISLIEDAEITKIEITKDYEQDAVFSFVSGKIRITMTPSEANYLHEELSSFLSCPDDYFDEDGEGDY